MEGGPDATTLPRLRQPHYKISPHVAICLVPRKHGPDGQLWPGFGSMRMAVVQVGAVGMCVLDGLVQVFVRMPGSRSYGFGV